MTIAKGDHALILEYLPTDHSRQRDGLREALRALDSRNLDAGITILDLGCGAGGSYEVFSQQGPKVRWIGLDIIDSQEVTCRPLKKLPFCAYDGIRIPLQDDAVDVVYSHQVFEHVRHPEALIGEVHRVLKPKGVFVGSTSQLEPFHSRSYWNYTPYGFCVLMRETGFQSILVRPGIDSLTLIARRCFSYLKLTRLFEPFFNVESPVNVLLEIGLRFIGQPTGRRNFFKLLLAGQFCFFAQK
jgi:SAM-dependent methyltransferase